MVMIKGVCGIWGHNRGSGFSDSHVYVSHNRTAKRQRGGNSVSWKSVPKLPISSTNCHVGGLPNTTCLHSSKWLDQFIRTWILFIYYVGYLFYREFVRSFLKYFSPPWYNNSSWPAPPNYWGFAITLRHTHTHTHSVGLLWTSDQPDAETSTGQHRTLTTDSHIHAPGGIWNRNPGSKRPRTGRSLDRPSWSILPVKDYWYDKITEEEMGGACGMQKQRNVFYTGFL